MSTLALRTRRLAFTLVELLVAMAVLVILIGVTAQMTSGVSSIVNRGGTHISEDEQARSLMDRMALDFGAMVKRSDVDYYLKGRPAALAQPGNDQIAFYTEVAGYVDSATATASGTPASTPVTQSPTALIAYRVNATTLRLERLCRGLVWNGSSSGDVMAFLPVPLASPLPSPLPSPMPTAVPTPCWPAAAEPDDTKIKDMDYEAVGPQVFRFEYYYMLKGQTATPGASTLSITPWSSNHVSVEGMRDVAGIGVLMAVLDQKSRLLVTKSQLTALIAQMPDATNGGTTFTGPGDLEQQWTSAVNKSGLPSPVIGAVRIYTRCFYLNGVPP